MDLRAIRYEWLWWVHRDRVRVKVRNTSDGLSVTTHDGHLHIPSYRRVRLYRHGIQARIDDLAASYGIAQHVTLRPGDLVLDIGANIGEFSLWAAARGAKVIAFEPDPTTLACLRENIADRPVEIEPIGLWHEAERMTFFTAPDDADGSLINQSDKSVSIDVLPLDNIMEIRGFPPIRLIKMDAEGAEPEVLRGAAETLKHTTYIAIDAGSERNGESTLYDCEQILQAAGFTTLFHGETRGTILCARVDHA